jgi:LysM domain
MESQMLSNQGLAQFFPARRRVVWVGLCAAMLTLAGCASNHLTGDAGRSATGSGTNPADDANAADTDLTATDVAAAKAGDDSVTSQPAPVSAMRDAVKPDAPASYTVQRGDTLWDLANLFLKDPWLWPEIWQINQQVENPHLIYPGDVLALGYGANGAPQITLARAGGARLDPRLRTAPLDGAIATIPYAAIASFLERPTVLSNDQLRKAPRVLGFRDGHMIGGAGHEAYVKGLKNSGERSRYNIYRIGDRIVDPDDGTLLGYMGAYTATAVVLRPGDTTKIVLEDTARETLQGDPLIAGDSDTPLNFLPRAPGKNIRGEIVAVFDGTELIGQYRIIAINRGRSQGIELGHIMAIDTRGESVADNTRKIFGRVAISGSLTPRIKLPDERAGSVMIFKVYDRMSYGLTVSVTTPVRIGDAVHTP